MKRGSKVRVSASPRSHITSKPNCNAILGVSAALAGVERDDELPDTPSVEASSKG